MTWEWVPPIVAIVSTALVFLLGLLRLLNDRSTIHRLEKLVAVRFALNNEIGQAGESLDAAILALSKKVEKKYAPKAMQASTAFIVASALTLFPLILNSVYLELPEAFRSTVWTSWVPISLATVFIIGFLAMLGLLCAVVAGGINRFLRWRAARKEPKAFQVNSELP